MGRNRLGLALWAGISVSGLAATPFCFSPLADLASDAADAQSLVRDTYRDLWEKVGQRHLKPDELARIVANEDPFLEGERTPYQLFALKGTLHKFRDMLVQKGWNTPETRAELLGELRTLAGATPLEAVKAPVLKDNQLAVWDVRIESATFSPDGRWVLSGRTDRNFINEVMAVLDTTTGKSVEYKWPKIWGDDNIHLTPDSKWILARSRGGNGLFQVPFTNGVPEVDKATEITFAKPGWIAKVFKTKSQVAVIDILHTADPNVVEVTLTDGGRTYALDLTTKTTTFLRHGKKDPPFIDMGAVPGRNLIYTIGYTTDGEYVLKAGERKPDGSLKDLKVFQIWHEPGADGDPPSIKWNRDGEAALCYHWEPPLTLVERGKAEQISDSLRGQKPKTRIPFAFFSNDGKKVGAMVGTWEGGNRLYWYDRAAKTWEPDSHGVTTPGPSNYRLSPDGTKLLFGIQGGTVKVLPITPEDQ